MVSTLPWGESAGGDRQVVAQLGIVDLLQQFDLSKRIEHGFKRLMRIGRKTDISAVPAEHYASRFTEFVGDALAGRLRKE